MNSHINPKHASKLARILDLSDASARPQDINVPGCKLHYLSGKEKGTLSVWVTGNCRVSFKFDGPDTMTIYYLYYH